MSFRKIFYQSEKCDVISDDLNDIIDDIKSKIPYLHNLSSDDLIDFFDKSARKMEKNMELQDKIGPDIRYLISFMKKENLKTIINTALRGNREVLDSFIKLND